MALQLGPVLGKLGGADVQHTTIPAADRSEDTTWTQDVEHGDYLMAITGLGNNYGSPFFSLNGAPAMETATVSGGHDGVRFHYGRLVEATTQLSIVGAGTNGHRGLDVYWVKID